jgi:hypothetical protein
MLSVAGLYLVPVRHAIQGYLDSSRSFRYWSKSDRIFWACACTLSLVVKQSVVWPSRSIPPPISGTTTTACALRGVCSQSSGSLIRRNLHAAFSGSVLKYRGLVRTAISSSMQRWVLSSPMPPHTTLTFNFFNCWPCAEAARQRINIKA